MFDAASSATIKMSLMMPQPRYTLAEREEQVVNRSHMNLVHPLMREHITYAKAQPHQQQQITQQQVTLTTVPYPPLGMNKPSHVATPGSTPPLPVSGPSMPQCGSRKLDDASAFTGLSHEMATYNFQRTTSIMAGARPGC